MLLKQFDTIMSTKLIANSVVSSKDVEGTEITLTLSDNSSTYQYSSVFPAILGEDRTISGYNSYLYYGGVVLGTGSESASYEDYKLNTLATGFKYIKSNSSIELSLGSDGTLTINLKYCLTNANSDAVTISEIGIITPIYVIKANKYFLLYREVIDPVEVASGANVFVNITVNINTKANYVSVSTES